MKKGKKLKLPEELRKHFVELGRIGGLTGGSAGGKKRTSSMTPAQRKELAKKAAFARWKRKR
jgi:hypothetical protein